MRSMHQLLRLLLLLTVTTAATEPVDTQQFGFIREGMTEAEVLERLGQPDRVSEEPPTRIKVRINGRVEYRETRRLTAYYYAGNRQIMSAYVQFEDGRVVSTRKVRE